MKVGTDGVLLGAWANTTLIAPRILDIGTGTGIIALMMAQKFENAVIDAIEIDEQAFKQASENVKNTKWANRITVIHADLNDWIMHTDHRYDIVICNPPFFIKGWHVDDPARKKARDAATLPYEVIIKAAIKLVATNGHLMLILPIQEAKHFSELANEKGLFCIRQTSVFTKQGLPAKRMLMVFGSINQELEETQLCIADEENSYTPDYKKLTGDFYLNF